MKSGAENVILCLLNDSEKEKKMISAVNIKSALRRLGVEEGDSIITHSSFKSLGEVENGAQGVIDGMKMAVGEEGTVVFPTLVQNDFANAYKNWNKDTTPSDVGYLTEYFRKLPGAKRSDQATHSVAAIGKLADYITETHGQTGQRHGPYGETPFAADSPWEKMYKLNTKMLFIGVTSRKCTMHHYVEYIFTEKWLKKAEKLPNYKEIYDEVWAFGDTEIGPWPYVVSEWVEGEMLRMGTARKTVCGKAEILMLPARDYVDFCMESLDRRVPGIMGWSRIDFWLDKIENGLAALGLEL